jgi:hypothetical protein
MSRPLFHDAEKPARVDLWKLFGLTIGMIMVGAVVAVVIAWLFLHPVFQ